MFIRNIREIGGKSMEYLSESSENWEGNLWELWGKFEVVLNNF